MHVCMQLLSESGAQALALCLCELALAGGDAQSRLIFCDPVAHQAPLSMGFFRQESWSGLPFPSPGDLFDPGIKPGSFASPTWQADFLFVCLFLLLTRGEARCHLEEALFILMWVCESLNGCLPGLRSQCSGLPSSFPHLISQPEASPTVWWSTCVTPAPKS